MFDRFLNTPLCLPDAIMAQEILSVRNVIFY